MTTILISSVAACIVALGDPPPAIQPIEPAETVAESPVQTTADVAIVLSTVVYPEGVDDEAAFVAFLDRRAKLLASRVDEASSVDQRASAGLISANWILARQIEPAVSRMFWRQPQPGDAERVVDLIGQAKSYLAMAARSEQVTDPGGERAADFSPRGPKSAAGFGTEREAGLVLSAFADAIEAYCVSHGLESPTAPPADLERQTAQPGQESPTLDSMALRRAASGLAIAVEDAAPDVVSAAVLWRALLLERGGQRDRAMTLLPLPLTIPSTKGRPWGVMARVLRCRLLYESVEKSRDPAFAAASALLLQLEERAHEWFADESRRSDAIRACALERLAVTRRWSRFSVGSPGAPRLAWFERAQSRIIDDHFAPDTRPTLLRMELAVPMFFPMKPVADALPDPAGP